eukprot:gene15342-18191_t
MEHKISGFTERHAHLLNWALGMMTRSYNNQRKSPMDAPVCYDARYWSLIMKLIKTGPVVMQKQQMDDDDIEHTNYLEKDYLVGLFEFAFNLARNGSPADCAVDATTFKAPKKGLAAYTITPSQPPPVALMSDALEFLVAALPLFSTADVQREIPAFLENYLPLVGRAIKACDAANPAASTSAAVSLTTSILTTLQSFVVLGNSSKLLANNVLDLLPHLIAHQYNADRFHSLHPTSPMAASMATSAQTVVSLLNSTFYHPDSHWSSYPAVLFGGWMEPEVTKKAPVKDPKAVNPVNQFLEVEGAKKSSKEANTFHGKLILDHLAACIKTDHTKKIETLDDTTLPYITLLILDKLFAGFSANFNEHGKRQIGDLSAYTKGSSARAERLVEFAYFRKLCLFFVDSESTLGNKPIFYQALAGLLEHLASHTIFYQDNDHHVTFLSERLRAVTARLLSPKTSSDIVSSLLQTLAAFTRVSHVVIDNHLDEIFFVILSSPTKIESGVYFLKSVLDVYLAIRQSDNVLKKLNNTIITGKLRSICMPLITDSDLLLTLKNHFKSIPFGQMPIIWNDFLEIWKDYYIIQMSEDDDIRDPIFEKRLETFAVILTAFFDNIDMTHFATSKLQQILPQCFSFFVDPLLNRVAMAAKSKKRASKDLDSTCESLLRVYLSFSAIHSYVHRQAICGADDGTNDYGYHKQQYHYYQMHERELDASRVAEFIATLPSVTPTVIAAILTRIQQLNSLLSSASPSVFIRTRPAANPPASQSSLSACEPRAVEQELHSLVYRIITYMLDEDTEKSNQDWRIVLDNICVWCDYATPDHVNSILARIIAPQSANSTVQPLFTEVLANSQFYEIECFRDALPTVLTRQIQTLIGSLLRSKPAKPTLPLFDAVADKMVHTSRSNFGDIISKIAACFKGLALLQKDLTSDATAKMKDLAWMMALVPGFNPMYLSSECVGTLSLLAIISDLLITSISDLDDSPSLANAAHQALLSSRKFLKYCLVKDQSRLIQIIPMEVWRMLVFGKQVNYANATVDPNQMVDRHSQEIEYIISCELWEKHPMELCKLALSLIKDAKVNNQFGSGISMVLKSIVDNLQSGGGAKQNLPGDLDKAIHSIAPTLIAFVDEVANSPDAGQIVIDKPHMFLAAIHYLWFRNYVHTDASMNTIQVAAKVSALVTSLTPFIGHLRLDTVDKIAAPLHDAIVSLMELQGKVQQGNQSRFVALMLHLVGAHPEQSPVRQRVANILVGVAMEGGHTDEFIAALIGQISLTTRSTIHMSILTIINLMLNTGMRTTDVHTQLTVAIVRVIVNSSQDTSLMQLGLAILTKMTEIQPIYESMHVALTSLAPFEGPFIYSFPKSMRQYQTSDSLNAQPMHVIDHQFSSSPTQFLKLTPESFSSICRLLYTIQRLKNENFIKIIAPFINCLRCNVITIPMFQ